jgi:hypothetical protein
LHPSLCTRDWQVIPDRNTPITPASVTFVNALHSLEKP